MSPHRKRDGRYLCVEVISPELEELRQDTFKNGENHKLGDVKTLACRFHRNTSDPGES
jgi:hypothetical protein